MSTTTPPRALLGRAVNGRWSDRRVELALRALGIALLLQHITRAAIEAAGDTIDRVLRSVSPAWRPGMAFLAGKARRARHDEKPAANPELEALGKEIEERRRN